MGKIVPLFDPGNYVVVIARIRRLYETGTVRFHPHALKRMRERYLEVTDIQHIIRRGRITKHHMPVGATSIRYTIKGEALSGNRRVAACAVEVLDHLLIVTVL